MNTNIIFQNKTSRVILFAISLLSLIVVFGTSKVEAACSVDTSRGVVTQTFNVPSDQAGAFKVWARMGSSSANNDSFYLEIDGGACINVGDTAVPTSGWKWVDYQNGNSNSKIANITLSAGNHSLKMIGREDAVKVDKVLLVRSTTCVPTDAAGNPCLPDTTPPTNVTVSAPQSPLSGTRQLTATASDNDAIKQVTFRLNNTSLSPADSTSPYTYDLNTTAYANGTYQLTAVAEDLSGNTTTSNATTITINNVAPDTTKPTVSITNPANGSIPIPEGSFTFRANASDNVAISRVIFKLDGQEIGTSTTSPYSVTANLVRGNHNLEVTAVDSSNLTTTQTMTITVSAPTTNHSCSFNGDNLVGLPDLNSVLVNWKKKVSVGTNGDCNGANGQPDGYVSIDDLGKLLALWSK